MITAARAAGVLYLGTIVAGVYAEGFARSVLLVSGNAGATTANILAQPLLYRSSVVADLVMLGCYIAVTVLFRAMFNPINRRLSALAAGFSFIGIAVLAAGCVTALAPLVLQGSPAFDPGQRAGLTLLALDLHGQGYGISLVFFGVYCLMIGALVFRSGFLPRAIGVLMGVAGACYLVNSFGDLLAPGMVQQLRPWIMLPTLIGEGALALWLLAFGAKTRA